MNENTELTNKIREFFKEYDEYKQIDGETDLFREVGLNSIQLATFITYLEHLRSKKIDASTLDQDKIRTINNIIDNYF